MTPDQLCNRISYIVSEIDSLIEDVEAHIGNGEAPDTENLFECHYAIGDPVGLSVARRALEHFVADEISDESCREVTWEGLRDALDSPEVQRARAEARRRKLDKNPALKEMLHRIRGA